MVSPFNKKVNSNRTSEELERRYEEIQRAVDPKIARCREARLGQREVVNRSCYFKLRSKAAQWGGPRWKEERRPVAQ